VNESITQLAEEIQRNRPRANIPVVIELKNFSQKNIDLLISKGFKLRTAIRELKMLTGEIPADPKVAATINALGLIETLSTSSEIETL
jgi:hypothetical protein